MPTLPCRALVALCFLLVATGGCAWYMPPPVVIPGAASIVFDVIPAPTQAVTTIELAHPLTLSRAEISGLAWYGDTLILLPQFPERFEHQIFGLSKSAIVAQLAGQGAGETVVPLEPERIYLNDFEVQQQLIGSEGYEAIAFVGNRAYLTIETSRLGGMLGYVVAGEMSAEQNALSLNPNHLTPIEPQTTLRNMTDEALFLIHDQVATIYEANGFFVNTDPIVHLLDSVTLAQVGVTPFPNIEYRITDTTMLDENDRFWATNVFAPGIHTLRSFLRARGAVGPMNIQTKPTERLLEFQVTSQGIVRTETPPIVLELLPNLLNGNTSPTTWNARNWEGIVRLETEEFHGFLVVTDQLPETILAFVPWP